MSVGTLGDIRCNFHEIYQATHTDPSPLKKRKLCPVELYANLSPNLLPPEGNIYCRPWLNGFLHNDFTRFAWLEAIQSALDHTHQLFHTYQTNLLSRDLPKMQAYLGEVSRLKRGQAIDERQFSEARENIQNFWIATHFFLRSVHAEPNKRMQGIFKKHFCSRCFDHIEPLEQMQAILSLQGALGETLPLKALIEASFGNEVFEGFLSDFVKKIKSSGVPFDILHYALKAIVEYAAKYKMTQEDILKKNYPALDKLEWALDEFDPTLLKCKNPDHIAWRDTLHVDSEILSVQYEQHSGRQSAVRYRFILGEPIGAKRDAFDNNIYYHIKECYIARRDFSEDNAHELKYEPMIRFQDVPEKRNADIEQQSVIWISVNEAVAGLRHLKTTLYYDMYLSEYGFTGSQIRFIDNQGRFALVEKLHDNPTGLFKVIPKLIKTALTEVTGAPATLEPLQYPQKFMFDAESCMKATKLIKPAKHFSFSAWEQFVYDAAKGSQSTFKIMMKRSGLDDREEAVFLREALQASFREDKGSLEQSSHIHTFHDRNIFGLAVNLQNEMVKTYENCCRSLEASSSSPISKERVKQLLLNYHKACGSASFLWPSLQSDIISAYLAG